MTDYTIENGYYPDDAINTPAGCIQVKGPDNKFFWYCNPRAGYYPFNSENVPDGSIPVVKDGKKQWYCSPETMA